MTISGAITSQDLAVILLLIFLEGVLSIDNALVLAMLARDLPKEKQKKALTYGLVGAVVFRFAALFLVTKLLAWNWVKFVGGGYLLFLAIKHFVTNESTAEKPKALGAANFWKVVLFIELTDIAFALDSILAAVALSNKFWVVFTGGMIGVLMMRYAASLFLKILERFPGFETTAYLLVFIIGVKVILEGLHLPELDFHSTRSAAFWIFWALMAGSIAYGFKPTRKKKSGK